MFRLLKQWRLHRRHRAWARRAVARSGRVAGSCVLCGLPVTGRSGHRAWPTGVWLHTEACPRAVAERESA